MRWGVSALWWCHIWCVPHPSEEVSPDTARETLAEPPAMKAQGEGHKHGKSPARGRVLSGSPPAYSVPVCPESRAGGGLPWESSRQGLCTRLGSGPKSHRLV